MNQIAWQIFGGSKSKANTFIGGVASTITTAGALATKLGIASNRITNFKIVGSDIECSISGSYVLNGFYQDTNITSYVDIDGLVTDLAENVFKETTKIKELNFKGIITLNGGYVDRESQIQLVYLKNCTSILGNFYNDFYPAKKVFYIPSVTTLGATSGDNGVFYNALTSAGCTIYANPSLQTSNGGGVEGDLAFAISNGATVRYVTNFTAPSPITNLTAGFVYGTAVQLNFTAPTGSANAIDYYEIWLNGVNSNKTITASGQYIKGLSVNTTYTIELKPVDIFYNKSTSNTIAATTAATLVYQDRLVSYYKMENNVLDSWGTNNGTATAITYASGLVGQTAVLNGTTSNIIVPDSNNLSFGNGTNDSPFSISFILNLNSITDQVLINKLGGSTATDEYFIAYWGNKVLISLKSGNNNALSLDCITTSGLSTGVNHIITMTYDGSKTANGIKVYFNNVLQSSTNTIVGAYVAMNNKTAGVRIGRAGWTSSYFLNGKLDEVSIWNAELTALQISEINAKLNTGQSLI